MHTNPSQVQQVYMGCDALYWITDGDCQKQSFAAFEQTLQPRHMIVSEFWIQRDMIPMDFVTMDAGGVGFDSFECVEQGERFQMRAALRSRALQYIPDCVQFPQLDALTPETDWVCSQQLEGVFAWHSHSQVTACLVVARTVRRVGHWPLKQHEEQVHAWAARLDCSVPELQCVPIQQIVNGSLPCSI